MSDVRTLVRETYLETVKNAQIPEELKRALKTHERVPRFVDNLAREFSGLTFNVKRETIISTTRDLTLWFVKAVEIQSQQRLMSELDKVILKTKQAEQERFKQEAEALEKAGTTNVRQDQKGETEKQTISFDEIFPG